MVNDGEGDKLEISKMAAMFSLVHFNKSKGIF